MIKVLVDGRTVVAKARDLSMAGLCLIGDVEGIGQAVDARIPLPNDREVVAGCRVKRRRSDAVALEFAFLGWEDLFALARFLYPRLP